MLPLATVFTNAPITLDLNHRFVNRIDEIETDMRVQKIAGFPRVAYDNCLLGSMGFSLKVF